MNIQMPSSAPLLLRKKWFRSPSPKWQYLLKQPPLTLSYHHLFSVSCSWHQTQVDGIKTFSKITTCEQTKHKHNVIALRLFDTCHEKTYLKVFVVVIPKEGWVYVAWHRLSRIWLCWHHRLYCRKVGVIPKEGWAWPVFCFLVTCIKCRQLNLCNNTVSSKRKQTFPMKQWTSPWVIYHLYWYEVCATKMCL